MIKPNLILLLIALLSTSVLSQVYVEIPYVDVAAASAWDPSAGGQYYSGGGSNNNNNNNNGNNNNNDNVYYVQNAVCSEEDRGKTSCPRSLNPVCGYLPNGGGHNLSSYVSFRNPCFACRNFKVTSYTLGTC